MNSAIEGSEAKNRPWGLEVEDVSASFGDVEVLKSVSLQLEAGQTLSLLGPSGCGKTTLLRAIAGLHTPDQGRVSLGDRLVVGPGTFVPPEHRQVGMVFQEGALFPHLSVMDNLLFGLSGRSDGVARAGQTLDLVGMSGYEDRRPGTLSGGQQQRVALARALAPEPQILLLDEPFSALDAGLRIDLRREVKTILSDLGVTVVVVTHDQEEAFVLGERVAVMDEGEIAQVGRPAHLYSDPVSAWVAGFVGEANLLDGHASGAKVDTELGGIPLRPGSIGQEGRVQVAIRPEQLVLAADGQSLVVSVEYFGHDTRYEVETPTGLRLGVRSTYGGFVKGNSVDVAFSGDPVPAWPAPGPR